LNSLAFRTLSVAILLAPICACRRREPPMDVMKMTWCDSTPMKPAGLRSRVPEVTSQSGVGALVGVVTRAETGDALAGAYVLLSPEGEDAVQSPLRRVTDSLGGFAFDSVAPARHEVQVRALGQNRESLTIQSVAGRVDTIMVRLRTTRCWGY
jgi:hypothetical protein